MRNKSQLTIFDDGVIDPHLTWSNAFRAKIRNFDVKEPIKIDPCPYPPQ